MFLRMIGEYGPWNISQNSNSRVSLFWTLPNSKILQMAFIKFDQNGVKFSRMGRNIVEKREIARFQQFFLFPTECFQNTCTREK